MIRTSFFYAFFLLLVTSISLNATDSPPNRNWGYDIQNTCYNTTENNCYPFHYENSDGSPNIFANYVAYLNIISPFINLCSYKLGTHLMNKWDKNIDLEVQKQLHDLGTMENNLCVMVGKIIQHFNNGISENVDRLLAQGMVEQLNRSKCEDCINEFVAIVSKSQGYDEFRTMIGEYNLNICQQFHDKKLVITTESADTHQCFDSCKSRCKGAYSAFFKKWNHPLNWTSISYVGILSLLTIPMALCVDVNNRAGSFIGDLANFSNIFFIPTAYWFSVYQNKLNLERKKTKHLASEISARLQKIEGFIEIIGRIIGEMDNHIEIQTARGFIKTLLIIGWPNDLVSDFIQIASNNENVDRNNFINALKRKLESTRIPYSDNDMKIALATITDADDDCAEIKLFNQSI